MRRLLSAWAAWHVCVYGLALVSGLCLHVNALGEETEYGPKPNPFASHAEMRSGGVLAESYQYHRYGAPHTDAPQHMDVTPHAVGITPHDAAPAGGWYGYGFPVQTHRWGWFGAGRYYPRVVWHRGYYDDCCRWAYRHGY